MSIHEKPTLGEFTRGILTQAEYVKFAQGLGLPAVLRFKIKAVIPGVAIEDVPQDHSGENRFVPPSHCVRWGFKRDEEDPSKWRHNFIKVGVSMSPKLWPRFADSYGVNWTNFAQVFSTYIGHGIANPEDMLCLTVASESRVRMVKTREELVQAIDEAIENPIVVVGEMGPRQSLLARLGKLFSR